MKLSELSHDQYRLYYGSRLSNVKPIVKQVLHCPFHEDSNPSFSLNLDMGVWKCHTENIGGGILDFEERWSKSDRQASFIEICRVLSLDPGPLHEHQEPEAIYQYRDARNAVLFEKLRYPGKKFSQRSRDESGKWVFKLPPGPKPIYNLPDVITSNVVMVCEGEKDCNNVNALNLGQYDAGRFCLVAATTNFDGAGKWDARYSPYFTGKLVLILPDNDAVGKRHADAIAAAVHPYAYSVRIVSLPGLPDKGDVTDYLATHTGAELWRDMLAAKPWQPSKSELLVTAPVFLERESSEIDWLVDRIIQRGANGFIVAAPKSGKSWCALDLALAVSLGEEWLGMKTERAPVAMITREDTPNLTRWRMGRLIAGRKSYPEKLAEWLWVNSKDQSPQFRIDAPEQLAEMVEALKVVKPELIILDVLNVLHSADENDSTEMRKVMDAADTLHRETKASVGILHHFNKAAEGRLTGKMRGSSAIAGWAEWVIGIKYETDNQDERTRIMQFELKAGESREAIRFTIETAEGRSILKVAEAKVAERHKASKAESLLI